MLPKSGHLITTDFGQLLATLRGIDAQDTLDWCMNPLPAAPARSHWRVGACGASSSSVAGANRRVMRRVSPLRPTEQVRTWYQQFLHGEMDGSASRWINDLQRGANPDQVLPQILASSEYFEHAGSTSEGFVREQFDDLLGREPTPAELRDVTRRLQTQKRDEVALPLIRGAGGQSPPPRPGDADYFAELREAIRRLDGRLTDLAEEIINELEGRRDLQRQVEAVIEDLRAFGRVARPGVPRERMVRAFGQLDRNLRELLEAVRRQAGDNRVLRRAAERTARSAERLHRAFSANVEPPPRPGPDLAREADDFLTQGKQLQRTTNSVLTDAGIGRGIKRNLDQFVERADRFRHSAKDGADSDRLRREFAAAVEPWRAAVRDINTLPLAGGYGTMRQQAQRMEQIGLWIQRQLGAKGDIPYISTAPPRK
jgi:hypothetical protein